jgi:hypothetical protein
MTYRVCHFFINERRNNENKEKGEKIAENIKQ